MATLDAAIAVMDEPCALEAVPLLTLADRVLTLVYPDRRDQTRAHRLRSALILLEEVADTAVSGHAGVGAGRPGSRLNSSVQDTPEPEP
jgi:hypothetical protein